MCSQARVTLQLGLGSHKPTGRPAEREHMGMGSGYDSAHHVSAHAGSMSAKTRRASYRAEVSCPTPPLFDTAPPIVPAGLC